MIAALILALDFTDLLSGNHIALAVGKRRQLVGVALKELVSQGRLVQVRAGRRCGYRRPT